MKSILMSIKPKWVEKIARGEKTVEVRKSVPKCDQPFKVYMYCTNDRKETLNIANGQGFGKKGELYLNGNCYYPYTDGTLNGKVVGEFVCDNVICCQAYYDGWGRNHLTNVFSKDIKMTCLSEYELWDYIAGKAVKANEVYDGWLLHISDLKIYDKPKELGEFVQRCSGLCADPAKGYRCPSYYKEKYLIDCDHKKIVTRPPQSWCYVEERK